MSAPQAPIGNLGAAGQDSIEAKIQKSGLLYKVCPARFISQPRPTPMPVLYSQP